MWYLGSEEGASSWASGFNLFPSGWFYQNMLTISQVFQDFIMPTVDEKARRVFPDISAKGESAVEQMRPGPYTIFAKLLLPALEKSVRRSARMQTFVDATRVGCALERYRLANTKLPDSLAMLVPGFLAEIPKDVIDGKPLRYRLQSKGGYVLYSVGWNQTDEGGELAWTKPENWRDERGFTDADSPKRSVDITKGDWVWQMAAR
jgi:hypothetical protein